MTDSSRQVNKWLITLTVMIPAFMEIVDTSIANVALPHMQGSLNAGTEEITWVLTSYLISNAIVMPMTGWLARVFGRKHFLMACIVTFTVASLLCGAAPNLGCMVFFRILQGAAGGALIPMSQAIMMESFPPNEGGMAMAIFGIGAMFGPVVGPTLGGWITDNITWRWIFYVNIPVGIVAIIMVNAFVFDPPYLKKQRSQIDYWGLALLTLGIGALQIVLDKGQQEDWFSSSFITSCSIVAAVSLIMLVYAELQHPHPVVNLRLFKDGAFASGNCIMFMVGFCLYGSVVMLPLFLQTLMGYSATMAGLVMAPGGCASVIVMPMVGAYLKRGDGRKIVLCGLLLGAWSLYLMRGFTLQASFADFMWPRVLLGAALGMIFPPLARMTLANIPRVEMGNATGIYNLLRNIGGSVGIAVSATLLTRLSQFNQANLSAQVNPYNPLLQSKLAALQQAAMSRGADLATARKVAQEIIYRLVRREAAMLSYSYIFWIIGMSFLAIIPLLFFLRKPRET
ncbi:DHA2 family efflux MFS transporter permease subunit [Geomonas sp. RF6]|uniref:DHA2 family efflux MFS transporter permease subunit n=1 Tax=Geomonas sp. RF6 TaxID=2897342 RepID=UPI001E312D1B|nr:DHA2 family efflux MFS transporter permease subunit [Geomonas sp. RF6]UFS70836.1 DHA2 family efflux MFS transporter permease subunit [Geomonas sp. RF6]